MLNAIKNIKCCSPFSCSTGALCLHCNFVKNKGGVFFISNYFSRSKNVLHKNFDDNNMLHNISSKYLFPVKLLIRRLIS